MASQAVTNYVAAVSALLNEIGTSIDGVVGDVTQLNATIAKLHATQGQLTAEDEALLGTITTLGLSLASKAKAADDLTAPAEVPTPPSA